MVNQQLVDYFRQYSSQYNPNQLIQSLIQQGHNPAEVNEAARIAFQGFLPPNAQTQVPQSNNNLSQSIDLFNFDQQTKDTMLASIIGLIIAQMVIFFGDFLIGRNYIMGVIYTLIYAAVGGAISGFLISKFYYQFMDFISKNLSFLRPLTNTFLKFLFVPVIIGSIFSLLSGLLAGGAILTLGASLYGSAGGILGGILGGSLILSIIWSIVVTIIGRYIYAKFMVFKVGKYYKDYK